MAKFTIEIELGNEAMRSPEDVADVLHNIASDLLTGRHGGFVSDVNGNPVGEWEFSG